MAECKYLAVRNWAKFQERIKGMDVRRPFIRDACSKDSDPDYSQLTFFQRYVLDGMRRLTGLHGQNPRNDPTWVARALCAGRKDRPHVPHAVHTLTARGFLLLTNQADPFSNELNEKKETEEKVPSSPSEKGKQEQDTGPAVFLVDED